MKFKYAITVAAISMAVLNQSIADWPQWRGPGGQGHAASSKLPVEWGEGQNVAWRTNLPGRGWSSPVIAGNQIWVTTAYETSATEAEKKERLKANTGDQPLEVLSAVRIHALCLDKGSGKITRNVRLLTKKNPQ